MYIYNETCKPGCIGELLFSLYFRYYTQTFFAIRLIINKINKAQWVDFKLENVLVSLYSLKTMGLGSIIFYN
jgi:hypothetical protein